MKKNTQLIPLRIGLALAALAVFGGPVKSLADCTTPFAIQNPDFELWPTGTPNGTCTYTPNSWTPYVRTGVVPCLQRNATGVEHGTYYLYVDVLHTPNIDAGGVNQTFAVNPGSTYTIAGWFNNVHADTVGTVKVSPNASGATYASATQIGTHTGTTGWNSWSGNVTASGTSMILWLDAADTGSTKGSRVVAYDNITVTKVSDPPPTKLAFSAVPAYGYTGVGFSVTVQAQDANGYPQCATSDTTVGLTLASGGGTLAGTASGVISSGSSSVTIAGVTYSAADTMTITATPTVGMTGLTPATSVGIPFQPPLPTQLVYTAVPSFGNVGEAFAVTVQAQDNHGAVWPVTTDTTITLTVASGSGTLGGTTSGTMTGGNSSLTISGVTYNTLTPDTATLTATASLGTPALLPVTSGNIFFRNAVNEPILWNTTSGNWDGISYNWIDSSFPPTPAKYADNDDVIFEDTQSGASPITVTLVSTFAPGSVTVNNSTKVFTITGGAIGGGTGLTKQGTGVLTMSAANTFTGPTELGGGTLVAANSAALGAGVLTLDTATTTLELDNDVAMNVGRNTAVSASMTIKSGRLTSGAGVTHTLGTLSIGANTLSVVQGPNVTGTAGLAFGAATQSGAAIYNLGTGTLLTLASLDNGGANSTFQGAGSATVTGPAINSGTVIMNGTGTVSLNGVNSCSGGMTISAAGKLYLGNALGTSTSSGAVSVSGSGVLELADYRAIGLPAAGPTVDVTLNGGILQSDDTANVWLLPCAGSGAVNPRGLIIGASGGTINLNASASQVALFNDVISGATPGTGTLIVNALGELRSYGVANTFGKLIIMGGGVTSGLQRGKYTAGQGNAGALNTSFGAVPATPTADAITLSNACLNVNGPAVTLDPNQGITLLTGGGQTNTLSSAGATYGLTIPGIISGSGELRFNDGAAGVVTLSGANTFSGKVRFITSGSSAVIANTYAFQNATLDFNSADFGGVTVNPSGVAVLGGVTGGRNWSSGATEVQIGNNNQNTTWAGHLNDSPVGIKLTKIGNGTLTFAGTTGTNAYTGDTTISSGTLKLDTQAYINKSSIIIAGGATFDVSTMSTAMTMGTGLNTQALKGSGNGSSGTITMAASRGLSLIATTPLQFTAYNGVVAPLTVSGAGGSLNLVAGSPVTVTVANGGTPLSAGSYKLIAKSGSATVAGTAPTSLTVNGDGIGALSASLRIGGGELWMDVVCPSVTISSVTPVNVSCLGGNNGSITVAASGGTGSLSFSKDGGVTWVAAASPCTFTGLTSGLYNVWVEDSAGCVAIFASNPVLITQPATAVAISAVTPVNVSCNGGNNGSITVTASGGTGALQFSKDGGATWNAGTSPYLFSGLTAAAYNIQVKDANSCTAIYGSNPVTLTQPTALTAGAGSDATICVGKTNTLNGSASGGTSPYTYAWTPTTGLDHPSSQTPNASPAATTTYTLTVTDAHSCTATATVTITVDPLPTLSAILVGSDVVVYWPVTCATTLYQNPDATNPAGWVLDTNPVNVVGGVNYVTNAMSGGMFFQLRP